MDDIFQLTNDEYLPLRDVVFVSLRQAILTGKLKPGERLMEKHLGDRLGVSRTPIREALRRLETEGLITIYPRRGAQVAQISEKDIQDVLEVRASLEALAARLACEHFTSEDLSNLMIARDAFEAAASKKDVQLMAETDEKMHNIIFQASHNIKLIQMINNLREQIFRYRLEYLKDKNSISLILAEHEQLVAAIKNRHVKLAEELAQKHIVNQHKKIIKIIHAERGQKL